MTWFKTYNVPEGTRTDVPVGPLTLSIERASREWRIATSDESNPSEADLESNPSLRRFLTEASGNEIRLSPLLSDRPVVARPEIPLAIPAGDDARIFVSTPVWIRVALLEPDRTLLEIPSTRLSDTWFGPDTRRGFVAYASRTAARVDVANLPPQPHRAVTAITIRNKADVSFHLDRLSVPAPTLPLFSDHQGGLWTAPLVAYREGIFETAKVEIDSAPPPEAVDAELLTPAREPLERTVLSRALQVLAG